MPKDKGAPQSSEQPREDKAHTEALQKGMMARKAGRGVETNPYTERLLSDAWKNGWIHSDVPQTTTLAEVIEDKLSDDDFQERLRVLREQAQRISE